jgi:glycosyltransferase involved in cell wall biosynthesis
MVNSADEYIAVLIATYNGDKYLRQQIDSIVSGSKAPHRIYIRDDGSSDNTIAIANDYKMQFPKQFDVATNSERLGATRNFL